MVLEGAADRIKPETNVLNRYKKNSRELWWSFKVRKKKVPFKQKS